MPNVYGDDEESLLFADESEWMDEHDDEEEDGADLTRGSGGGPGSSSDGSPAS